MVAFFTIYKLVVFENRVVGIMFELKTEELGRKGCIHNLQCMSDTGVSKNSHKMRKECGMHGSESNLEQNFDWKT